MFRFTTRDVLWLMLVVALGLGWLVHLELLGERLSTKIRESQMWESRFMVLAETLRSEGRAVEWTDDTLRIAPIRERGLSQTPAEVP
jgi:hypothetical protein